MSWVLTDFGRQAPSWGLAQWNFLATQHSHRPLPGTVTYECGLTGTKLGCGEGGCGACTVLISSFDGNQIVHMAVNACLYPLYSTEGKHIVTVEGIGNNRTGLHPVQAALSQYHGSQCGFCTPGFIMSMYSLLRSKGRPPSEVEIEECLAGNLCRCTGYRPILDAFKVFALPSASEYTKESIGIDPTSTDKNVLLAPGAKICPSTGQPCTCVTVGGGSPAPERNHDDGQKQTSFPSDPIFPPELRRHRIQSLTLAGPECSWHRPVALEELLDLKHKLPTAKLVVGNTEIGIEMKFKHAGYANLIDANHIPELVQISSCNDGLTVGASVSLTRLMDWCKNTKTRHLTAPTAILEQLRWFAGNQIRNVASVGGNIVTGSPISDLNPLLIATGAVFRVVGKGTGVREIPARKFFLGYRKVDLEAHEILLEVFIPATKEQEYVKEFKQARRREDDIAIVTAVEDSAIAYGGVAATTISAPAVEDALNGKPWSSQTLKAAMDALKADVLIPPGAPGGMSEYRTSLAASFLFKFFLSVSRELEIPLPSEYLSGIQPYSRPPCSGVQYYAEVDNKDQPVGKPIRHLAADLQVCGEAEYCDDIPVAGCLHAALVTSTSPHARICAVDSSEATQLAGVWGYYSYSDVPGSNSIGPVVADEQVFASETVTCVGQVIGVVIADSQPLAQKAARMVRIEYDDLDPILTIAEAIDAESFYECRPSFSCGDVESAFSLCDHILEGEATCGGQEHFYLETHACIVVPKENDELLMISSTQAPYKHTSTVAKVLAIPEHKVVCKTKRIGGGFGGKETRSVPYNAAIAVPAYHLKKPIRLCLDRDEDMKSTGHRHAFLSKYKLGFNSDGTILSADIRLYCNAGNSLDLSEAIMTRALLHSDAAYKIPNMRVQGWLCRTNLPSNTAFRGFGGPQGSVLFEMCIERAAKFLGKSSEEIRSKHLYGDRDVSHFGQSIDGSRIHRCWKDVMNASGFQQRLPLVKDFNAQNRFRKRGIAVTPTKFGISFTTKFLNQAGALVHVYTDGSVLVTHGGVEMGQGLHTKMCQVAATALGVPLASVHISETATDKVPNASPTAASASSDLYGGAILDACLQIKKRLAPFQEQMPEADMEQVVKAAYLERVDLSAHGFYRTPDITGSGGERPFNYFCYGAACTEVELDILTGDWHALRVDIVMDVGNPINPAIDIGQIEGGFVQGMGWLCLEDLVWGDSANPWIRKGHLHTAGPGTYKIPTANDIPIEFRVSLLKDAANPRAIHSSKAVGEPPFLLANSVFFALKNAVYAARQDGGLEGWFRMDAPCTPEKLRMAAGATAVEDLQLLLQESAPVH